MPYPYKKMTQEDFDKIIEITDNERVWVGDEIAKRILQRRDAGIWSISTGIVRGSIE